jgi:ribonuclease D
VWSPPPEWTTDAFALALAEHGVRQWQRDIVAPMLAAAFDETPVP